MAQLINSSNTPQEVTPLDGEHFQLEELQNYVGGYIQLIDLDEERYMVMDEEGKFKHPQNELATDLAHDANAIFEDDYIAGNVLVCEKSQIE